MSGELRHRYLDAMGIQVWVPRDGEGNAAPAIEPSPGAAMDWESLAGKVAVCTGCALHRGRTQTVFGVGDRNASLMIIGEAPGAEEDRQGEPFVGRAGQLLNAMLAAIGLGRDSVYIANILKCRPPNNRDPGEQEAASCTPYLQRQIELVSPRVIMAVGRIAAQWLLDTDRPLGKLRQSVHQYGPSNTPLLVTYHPAYLLRSPAQKRKAWEDLKRVRAMLGELQ